MIHAFLIANQMQQMTVDFSSTLSQIETDAFASTTFADPMIHGCVNSFAGLVLIVRKL
jgi:hypothetical protein